MLRVLKFNKLLLAFGCWLLAFSACTENTEDPIYRQAIASERMAINEYFFNPKESPLDSHLFYTFKGIKFFPISEKYRVKASLSLLKNDSVFELPHSHDATKPYKQYAVASFELLGKSYELLVLEQVVKKPGAENYLLLPFTDATSNIETYGGGRYIDLDKTAGTEITIDFNKAYNPYCLYNSKYTCPIPPKENKLPIRVEAGMKAEL
jgi:uncharacterized protein (DUF1684 family)